MKTSYLLGLYGAVLLLFPVISLAKPIKAYSYLINVKNQLNTDGYFAICNNTVQKNKETMCSIPQHIHPGDNLVLVQTFNKMVPTFTLADETTYTCASTKNLTAQFAFSGHRLTLNAFLQDSSGNNVAMKCNE